MCVSFRRVGRVLYRLFRPVGGFLINFRSRRLGWGWGKGQTGAIACAQAKQGERYECDCCLFHVRPFLSFRQV